MLEISRSSHDGASNEPEEKALKRLNHTIVKLFHVEEDQDFKYLKNETVFELAFLKLFENKYCL